MLRSFFRALTERFKALFATSAALELESEFLARDAERRAELLRQADRYDAEGLGGIAQHLRRQAETLSLQRPTASVLPAIDHIVGKEGQDTLPLLAGPCSGTAPATPARALIPARSRRKGR
jgi:hypothetical protein